jgi:Carboxypeptidase regulatory-like domain/Putative zinc-finger
MSEPLQFEHHPDPFGYHLDADQISAFVEQALPAHERDAVLGHLAVCSECRAIVALSLPEVEAPVQPLSVPARKPWWLSWTLAFPVAGALAAAALAFVYFYPARTVPAVKEPEVADERPAPPLADSDRVHTPAERQAQQDSRKTSEKTRSELGGVPSAAPGAYSDTLRPGPAVDHPMLSGRNVAAMPQQAASAFRGKESLSAPAKPAAAPTPGASGTIAGIAKLPPTVAEQHPREPAAYPTAPVPSAAMQAAPAAPPTAGAAETVTEANGAPVNTVSAEIANPGIALDEVQGPQLKGSLPSHLAILSSAVLGQRMVAIDAEHNVFASKDGGKHWKLIPTPWQGHAARVDLVHLPRAIALGSLSSLAASAARPSDASLALKGSGAATVQTSPPSPATMSNLTGTVTDRTGAVIPGATVTAFEIATGTTHEVKTDAAGRFALNQLPAGNYRVEGQSTGFRKREIASVAVQSTSSTTANLILDVGESTQTVTVEADSAAVSLEQKKRTKPENAVKKAPIFEIVTESGDRWTSADGLSWQHN